MKRIDALRQLAPLVTDEDLVIISLGGTGLEWNTVHPGDNNLFLVAMGCNTPVALGLARTLRDRRIVLLETDGSLLLTLGALATLGNIAPSNLRAFVFDNQGYERVKHDVSATSGKTDLAAIARGCGIADARTVTDADAFGAAARETMGRDGLSFVVAKVEPGIAAEVKPRPGDGLEDKYRFVR
ncbi:MAG TPA: thiamine pyrophosphate-dependent enzyme, partial [Candidatus Limnocylindrales bacterium]|nr:thiamine pyrophosphate-dependent enzyme [Candidatus Limnocylindrales bacterium]